MGILRHTASCSSKLKMESNRMRPTGIGTPHASHPGPRPSSPCHLPWYPQQLHSLLPVGHGCPRCAQRSKRAWSTLRVQVLVMRQVSPPAGFQLGRVRSPVYREQVINVLMDAC